MTVSLCAPHLVSLGIAAGPRQPPRNQPPSCHLRVSPQWYVTSQASFSASVAHTHALGLSLHIFLCRLALLICPRLRGRGFFGLYLSAALGWDLYMTDFILLLFILISA